MKRRPLRGDSVGTFIFRHLGEDSDELENQFYELNPAFKGVFLLVGVEYELPKIKEVITKTGYSRWE